MIPHQKSFWLVLNSAGVDRTGVCKDFYDSSADRFSLENKITVMEINFFPKTQTDKMAAFHRSKTISSDEQQRLFKGRCVSLILENKVQNSVFLHLIDKTMNQLIENESSD